MERCQICQEPLDPTTRLCQQCGQGQRRPMAQWKPAEADQPLTIPCAACGTLHRPRARYCHRCGQALHRHPAPATNPWSEPEAVSLPRHLPPSQLTREEARPTVFDFVVQIPLTVAQDLQARVLSRSLTTTPWLRSPISRLIEQPLPPFQVMAFWKDPALALEEKEIERSVAFSGGGRHPSGMILSFEGEVCTRGGLEWARDPQGRPFAYLHAPTSPELDLRKLKVTYQGLADTFEWMQAVGLGGEQIKQRLDRVPKLAEKLKDLPVDLLADSCLLQEALPQLRPALCTQVMRPLAWLPLTAWPRVVPTAGVVEGYVLTTPPSVVLGLTLGAERHPPLAHVPFPPPEAEGTIALGLSGPGLAALLGQLARQAGLKGQMMHRTYGPMEWRWENLQLALELGQITLAGTLWQQGTKRQIQATLSCQIDSKGRLICSVSPSSSLDVATAETVQVSWKTILTRLLRSQANEQAGVNPREAEKLYQVFDLPSNLGSVETVAQALSVESDWLILRYPLPPLSTRELVVVEPDAPAVTIAQPDIPSQPASGTPVPIIMQATLTSQSYPPYDYAWLIGRSPLLQPMHTEPVAFTARPGPFHLGGPKARKRKLTTVRLKLIDGLGQVAEAKRPAYYVPAHNDKQKQLMKRVVASLATALVVLALIYSGIAYGGPFILHLFDRATVTLTPTHSDQSHTFTLTAVLSAPDASKQQVGARFLATPPQTYTMTVDATDSKIVPTQATGTLTVTLNFGHLDFPIGYQFTSTSGVTIATDAEFNETSLGSPITRDILAHAVNPGSSGNILSLAINIPRHDDGCSETHCPTTATIQNLSAFAGGTDASTLPVVAQSDIDNATNSLLQANQPNAQQLLQGELRPGEQLTGTPQGFPTTSADHHAGDVAARVTVTVIVTWVGEAYDYAGALALAGHLLRDQAARNPGAGYALVGQITTTLVSATPDSQGTVVIQVATKGRWAYQFSVSQQQTLIHLIVGKGKQDAQHLLAKQPGVAEVSIQITGENEQTLPTYPFLIRIEVQAISGL